MSLRRARSEDGRATLRLWLRLLTCTNLVESRIRTRLRQDFHTTLPRFDMLAQLDAAEDESGDGLTMSELSRRLMVTNGNVTGLATRLVREKLVTRTVSARDRRTLRLRLTPAGRRAMQAMAAEHRRWVEAMFSALSPVEGAELYRLIGKLKESVQEARP
ncbi:MAG: MarR family transcriptional regulator [Acidobacteriales bacterium]|nr:MarR family transcriptional regulator [Terriglobales bacterium]